jgi:hypothetical protein
MDGRHTVVSFKQYHRREEGVALALVLGIGVALATSALALSYAAYQSKVSSIQSNRLAQAEANAESGAALIYNALNNEYFFLARASRSKWSSIYTQYKTINETKKCDGFTLPSDPFVNNHPLSGNGNNWELIDYQTNPASGTAWMRLTGTASGSAQKTQIQYTYTLKSQPATGSIGFPGLLAQNITLGNNDILGVKIGSENSCSGNILCTNCQSITDVNQGPNSIVDGVISVGSIQWPAVPTQPNNIIKRYSETGITDDTTLPWPGDNKSTADQPTCYEANKNSDGTCKPGTEAYFYLIKSINLSGSKTIKINTLNCTGSPNPTSCKPVILYVTGDISMSGSASFTHEPGLPPNGEPEDFIIYGNSVGGLSQSFTLSGGSVASSIFVYAPEANIGINGGSSTPDFYGAVWGKTWNGSNSNNAEIQVPVDMFKRVSTLPLSPLPSLDYRLQSASSWRRGEY